MSELTKPEYSLVYPDLPLNQFQCADCQEFFRSDTIKPREGSGKTLKLRSVHEVSLALNQKDPVLVNWAAAHVEDVFCDDCS